MLRGDARPSQNLFYIVLSWGWNYDTQHIENSLDSLWFDKIRFGSVLGWY